MAFRFFLAIVALLFWQPSIAGQTDNYPFSVTTDKISNGHRIVAHNAGPAPVSVKVSIIDSQYIATDRNFPLYVVVPPGGGTLYLGDIRPAMPGVGYTFRTQYTWVLGDFNAAQSPDAMYRLPYRDGTLFRLGQSPGGPITTHNTPESRFAVDIPMPEGTPILASRDGTVIYTEANQIYGAKIPDMLGKANEVRILHIDGSVAIYAHLSHGGVYVYPGQRVSAGQQIGLAGSTGYSSGPHLHFAVQVIRNTGDQFEVISLPFQFYVGNPPTAFPPQFGMLAKANYSAPEAIPAMTETIPIAGSPNPSITPAIPTGNVDALVSLKVPQQLRSFLRNISAWTWFVASVLLVLFIIHKSNAREAERQKDLRRHEPLFKSWEANEPTFPNLSTKDRLIIACSGDRQMVQRLMDYECNRAPNINDVEAASRAWQRLQRDKR